MTDLSAVQIPKPKDWQAFQRGCVPLFRKVLNDPNLHEFGRSGQNQSGIDLLGYRDGRLDARVAVQCRHVNKLTAPDVAEAVNKARSIDPPLSQIVFATTAPDDVALQTHALQLTEELRVSGWSCRITIMGWETLQNEIAACPEALTHFWPQPFPSISAPTIDPEALRRLDGKLDLLIARGEVSTGGMRAGQLSVLPTVPDGALGERSDVHVLISTCRDWANAGKTESSIARLEQLRRQPLELEPFARYRVDAIIGLAHLRAGRPAEALQSLEVALSRRPDDPTARANVALAALAAGDAARAQALSREVLATAPDHALAVAAAVQASADDAGVTDPWALVTENVRMDRDVLTAVVVFYRSRRDARWADTARAAQERYPDDPVFARWVAEAVLEPVLEDPAALYGRAAEGDLLARIVEAADCLDAAWRPSLQDEAPNPDLLAAGACNLAGTYRWLGQPARAAAVVDQAIAKVGLRPELVRARVLLLLDNDDDAAALAAIGPTPVTAELALLRVEVLARTDKAAARQAWETIAFGELPDHLARAALRLRIELALDERDFGRADSLVGELHMRGEGLLWMAWARAHVAIARWRERTLTDAASAPASVPEQASELAAVQELARYLQDQPEGEFAAAVMSAELAGEVGLHEVAARALRGRVRRDCDNVALRCYVSNTVAAGLAREALETLNGLPDQLRGQPFYLRALGLILWNEQPAISGPGAKLVYAALGSSAGRGRDSAVSGAGGR